MSLNEKIENSGFFSNDISEIPTHEIPLKVTGDVFTLTRCLQHRKWVVRKSLQPNYQNNPAWRQSLVREFETGYRLSHHNLVQYYHLEEHEKEIHLIREWVDGETVSEWACRYHSASQRQNILMQILEATQYLHRHQIYHRDLSPSNILITHKTNQVKIIDFGFSAGEDDLILAAGTPAWSPPEQLKGASPSPQGDLYSIGKIAGLLFPETKKT